jgi:hypothetical protein
MTLAFRLAMRTCAGLKNPSSLVLFVEHSKRRCRAPCPKNKCAIDRHGRIGSSHVVIRRRAAMSLLAGRSRTLATRSIASHSSVASMVASHTALLAALNTSNEYSGGVVGCFAMSVSIGCKVSTFNMWPAAPDRRAGNRSLGTRALGKGAIQRDELRVRQ